MRRERRRRRQEDQLLVLKELEEWPLTDTAQRGWRGWGGAGPGAVGGEDGCPVWLGAGRVLQRRGQDTSCRELRGGWGQAEEGRGGHLGRSSMCKGPAPGDPGAVLRLGWTGEVRAQW